MPLLSLDLGGGFSVDSICHLADCPGLAIQRTFDELFSNARLASFYVVASLRCNGPSFPHRRGRRLARRGVAVRWCAIFVMLEDERPPSTVLQRSGVALKMRPTTIPSANTS
jgi:hypothetical protein